MKIAAIATCHNRKEKTLSCLEHFYAATNDCDFYLVDDGSTDGTSNIVKEKFPQVTIIYGDGTLFWSRGMHKAWEYALQGDYDFYIWVNDDVELLDSFLGTLFNSFNRAGVDCIVSGLVADKETGKVIYGGYDKTKKMIETSSEPTEIQYMNGNVVLIPKSVVKRIGIIDPRFHHDLGDVDYGLTAIRAGIKVVTSVGIVAYGTPNNLCRVRMWGTSCKNRFKKLNSPLGSPINIFYYFKKKHYGTANAILSSLYLIAINILPDRVIRLLFGDRYKN